MLGPLRMAVELGEVNGCYMWGYSFKEGDNLKLFIFDELGRMPQRKDAPVAHFQFYFEDTLYHLIEFMPSARTSNFPRPFIKALLETSIGEWIQECCLIVSILERPTYNVSGKESQCRYDQELMANIER